ncbi:MAG: hypothetical protein J6T78_04060 [Bacteroidaceae bacterium]|nr:hypothetical protein [Bacteroidaceae bacterium]
MKQEEILTAVKGVLNEQLVSEIARHFAEADKDFRENIVLRDRVDWLEKQLADASAVLDKKQPEAQTFEEFQKKIKDNFPDKPEYWIKDEERPIYELPTIEQIRTSSYNMARRENYYDSLRGRSKYLFNIKEEN